MFDFFDALSALPLLHPVAMACACATLGFFINASVGLMVAK